jgi:hypothetical protein
MLDDPRSDHVRSSTAGYEAQARARGPDSTDPEKCTIAFSRRKASSHRLRCAHRLFSYHWIADLSVPADASGGMTRCRAWAGAEELC